MADEPLKAVGEFSFPTTIGGSWPVTEKELSHIAKSKSRNQHPEGLKHSATMPFLGRITSNDTTTSHQFVKISTGPESAENGATLFRSILDQLGLSNVPGLASLARNFPIGLPPLVFPALGLGMPALQTPPFLPDIEVKSKHKKGAFGRKWKSMRAVLDTACWAGNWVSLETLDDLGIKEYLPLTEAEEKGAQAVGGASVKACGAINLKWRGVPGQQVRNCTRDFKMRFLVIDAKPAPFEILIGAESIWTFGILAAPIFMMQRRVVGLPSPAPVNRTAEPSYDQRKQNNAKLFEMARQQRLNAQNAAANNQIPNGNAQNGSQQAPRNPLQQQGSHTQANFSQPPHPQQQAQAGFPQPQLPNTQQTQQRRATSQQQ